MTRAFESERSKPGLQPGRVSQYLPLRSPYDDAMAPVRRQTYRKADRLTHDLEFDRVFASRLKKVAGPLVLFAAPREGRTRLGLSVGTKVGNAVARNTVKRRLREAFRRCKDQLPAGFDIVVNVRPHKPLIAMADCQRLLVELCGSIDREQQRRARRDAARTDETSA